MAIVPAASVVKLSLKWDPTYYKDQGLPHDGCFGYINGHLILGGKHHQLIMGALLRKGWTWKQLAEATQSWGWYGITNPEDYKGYSYADDYSYPGLKPDSEAKYWPYIKMQFASDAGVQSRAGMVGAIQAFQNMYHLPVKRDSSNDPDSNHKGVDTKGTEYGSGLAGKDNVKKYLGDQGDYYNDYIKTPVPDPPIDEDAWTPEKENRLAELQEKMNSMSATEDESTEFMNLWIAKNSETTDTQQAQNEPEAQSSNAELPAGTKVNIHDQYYDGAIGTIIEGPDEDNEYLVDTPNYGYQYIEADAVSPVEQAKTPQPRGGNPPPKKIDTTFNIGDKFDTNTGYTWTLESIDGNTLLLSWINNTNGKSGTSQFSKEEWKQVNEEGTVKKIPSGPKVGEKYITTMNTVHTITGVGDKIHADLEHDPENGFGDLPTSGSWPKTQYQGWLDSGAIKPHIETQEAPDIDTGDKFETPAGFMWEVTGIQNGTVHFNVYHSVGDSAPFSTTMQEPLKNIQSWIQKNEFNKISHTKTAGSYKFVWADGIFEVTPGLLKNQHHWEPLQRIADKLGRMPNAYVGGTYTEDPFMPGRGTVTVNWHEGQGVPSPADFQDMMQRYLQQPKSSARIPRFV